MAHQYAKARYLQLLRKDPHWPAPAFSVRKVTVAALHRYKDRLRAFDAARLELNLASAAQIQRENSAVGAALPRPIRRADRALTEKQAAEILQKGEYGILSTVSLDGQPYGVPVSYAYAGNVLYFHCAVEGHKLDNLASNPRVSFCVVGGTEVLPEKFATRYESAIVFGTARELTGDEKHAGLTEILKKYSPDFMEKGERYIESDIEKTRVFKIAIEALSGKARC